MSFLTPHVFDVLVIAIIVIGLILAAIRLRADFKSGPRWPEEPASPPQLDQLPGAEGTAHHTKENNR